MPKRSAALLLYRLSKDSVLEVLVGHMGGPFWTRKDARAWSIPKGEYEDGEDPLSAARREFEEEMGSPPPEGDLLDLGNSKQPSGKIILTYAIRGDFDLSGFRSNTFVMEWPKGSGHNKEFPEVDRAEWMTLRRASEMLVKGQVPILDSLREHLAAGGLKTKDGVPESPSMSDQGSLF
jgi:predicted NUDIX family NTP pyrophosphohydrolase